MSRRARTLLLGAVLTLGSAACQSKEVAEKPAATTIAAAGFHVGDQRSYRLELESEASIQGQPLTQLRLSGAWVVSTVDDRDGTRLLHAKLDGAQVVSKHPELNAQMAALATELEKPFGVELTPQGTVKGYVFVDTPTPLVVGIRQVLGTALQARVESSKAWTSEEQDGTGRFRAEYERQADGSLRRRKLAYTTLKSNVTGPAAMSALLPKVLSAQATLRLDSGGALESLESSESLSSGSGQVAPVDSKTKLGLALQGGRRALDPSQVKPLLEALRAGRPLAADAVWAAEVKDEQFDPARIGDHTLTSVLAGFRKLAAETPAGQPMPEKERADLFTALSAIVRSQPESRRQVIALVKQGDPLNAVLLDALSAAGEPESQTALADFLEGKKRDEKQLRIAAIGLSHTKNPTAEATAALVKLLDTPGLRTQALYGLGTQVSSLLAAGEQKRAKEVLAIILERLKLDSSATRITALRAVANSGHPDAYPSVAPFLTDKDSQVRAAAVEALQSMGVPGADDIIAKALSSDESSEVRRAAARAAAVRTPTPLLVTTLKSSARTDKNPHVRLTALNALAKYLPVHGELSSVIQDVAQNDPEASIRSAAARIVNAPAPPPG